MANLQSHIAGLGGLASMHELLRYGYREDYVHEMVAFGHIVFVRKGWYAVHGIEADVLGAWRVGGRLGCVSALAYYGLVASPTQLHVAVPANASRLRRTGQAVHWCRNDPGGDRRAVSIGAAVRQASRCRSVTRDSL